MSQTVHYFLHSTSVLSFYIDVVLPLSLWQLHNMDTPSALLALCEGNPLVTGGCPMQRTGKAGFNDLFVVSLNKQFVQRRVASVLTCCGDDLVTPVYHISAEYPETHAKDKVRLPPSFTSEPTSDFYRSGIWKTLKCSASGVPKPRYAPYDVRLFETIPLHT